MSHAARQVGQLQPRWFAARKSSLVRSDTGNGACEILYVTGFEVQHAAAAWPRGLFWLGILLWVAAAVVFVRTPHREH